MLDYTIVINFFLRLHLQTRPIHFSFLLILTMKQFKLIRLIPIFFILVFTQSGFAQLWEEIDNQSLRSFSGTREITPTQYRTFKLNTQTFASFMENIPMEATVYLRSSPALLEVPLPNGKMEQFHVVEYKMMEPALAEKYPSFKTVRGVSARNPLRRLRMDWTDRGFRGMITDRQERIFIDPVYRENQEIYQSYYKSDYLKETEFVCQVDLPNEKPFSINGQRSGDCVFRSYRLAVATTGEYSNFFGVTSSAGESTILSEVTTAVNRVNDVYEADVTVRMILVGNTNLIFYYDGTSDPYSNENGGTMLGQNQTTCDNVIGSANYDIGHVFSTGGGGIATLFGPCGSNKARGVTGQNSPINDPFYIDYVAHEMGHQFGANHTQNNSCNRVSTTSMEPGSASTIMGYAGICSPNVQSNSDDYFHGVSIQEINDFISEGNGNSCDSAITFINTAPTVVDQGNFTIPASTPFMLTANANDPDNNPLLYCWEQWDTEAGTMPPQSTNTIGPMFRSFSPETSPTRYFPRLSDLVNNSSFDWEQLPSVTRDMEFRITIRDDVNGVGCTTEDNLVVSTNANVGPFLVTSPGANVTWLETEEVTIQWDVANTDQSPVNCANVDILLSYDGGLTYPQVLATNVPNDGTQNVTIPPGLTEQGRVLVRCSDNIFFDISNNNITIETGVPNYIISTNEPNKMVCNEDQVSFIVDVSAIAGYSDQVSFQLNNAPTNASVLISPNPTTPGNQITVQLSNLTNVQAGTYPMDLSSSSTAGPKNLAIVLSKPEEPGSTILQLPADQAMNVASNPTFEWGQSNFATNYTLQVSEDQNFTAPIEIQNITSTSYLSSINLNPSTTYFWRVRGENDCFTSNWSSAFSFSTKPCFTIHSTDIPVNISEDGPNTITSILDFQNSGTIDDINASIEIAHTWTRDLRIDLTSPNNQTVRLLNRICGSSNDIDMILDDEAPDNNYPCPATDGMAYQPNQSLSTFDGSEANGQWQLTVIDIASQDGGALNNWSIEVCLTESCQLLVDQKTGSSSGSLSSAISCAAETDTILFDPSIAGDTIQLDASILLSKNVYLKNTNGQLVYITTASTDRIVEINNGSSLGLENLVLLGKGGTQGSAILNNGTLLLKDAHIMKSPGGSVPLILNNGSMDVLGNCVIDQ